MNANIKRIIIFADYKKGLSQRRRVRLAAPKCLYLNSTELQMVNGAASRTLHFLIISVYLRTKQSNIQVLNGQGVGLDEVAARLDLVA
ncbi:MAG: hypothetical protein AB2692_14660, partial [Candidatus Thiodiazotropha sp.]